MSKIHPETSTPELNPVTEASASNLPVGLEAMLVADAGKGSEEIDQSSFTIPRIQLLQPLSPVVNDADEDSGIRAGMFYNSATGEAFKEFIFTQAHFNRRYVRWDADNNFKGIYLPLEVEGNRVPNATVAKDGFAYTITDDAGAGDTLVDSRVHYILIRDPNTGVLTPAVFNLTRTQIKHSKRLITMIRTTEFNVGGRRIVPPSWAMFYRASVGKEKNERGQWYVWNFSRVGPVNDPSEYAAGKSYHDAVTSGEIAANLGSDDEAVASAPTPTTYSEVSSSGEDIPF